MPWMATIHSKERQTDSGLSLSDLLGFVSSTRMFRMYKCSVLCGDVRKRVENHPKEARLILESVLDGYKKRCEPVRGLLVGII